MADVSRNPLGTPRSRARRDPESGTIVFPIDRCHNYNKTVDKLLA